MKLTNSHIDFWRAKKAPEPAWFAEVRGDRPKNPAIDTLVNQHAGARRAPSEIEANNLLAILRLQRKRGALREGLASMAETGGTRPSRRAAYCRKWLAKIEAHESQQQSALLLLRRAINVL